MIQEPPRGTLRILNPRNQDLGFYQCFAENVYGIATSNVVSVVKRDSNYDEVNTFNQIVSKFEIKNYFFLDRRN